MERKKSCQVCTILDQELKLVRRDCEKERREIERGREEVYKREEEMKECLELKRKSKIERH